MTRTSIVICCGLYLLNDLRWDVVLLILFWITDHHCFNCTLDLSGDSTTFCISGVKWSSSMNTYHLFINEIMINDLYTVDPIFLGKLSFFMIREYAMSTIGSPPPSKYVTSFQRWKNAEATPRRCMNDVSILKWRHVPAMQVDIYLHKYWIQFNFIITS